MVIGILIALQINNWNEDRKARSLERELLEQLLSDLKEDEEFLKASEMMSTYAITSSKFVLKAAHEKRDMDQELETSFTMTTIPFSFFISQRATYDNLKSIGFQIVSNKSLRRQIQELYKHYEFIEVGRRGMDAEYLQTMDLQTLTKYDMVSEHLDSLAKGNQPLDWLILREDMVYLNNLANMINLHQIVLDENKQLKEQNRDLIAAIGQELEQ